MSATVALLEAYIATAPEDVAAAVSDLTPQAIAGFLGAREAADAAQLLTYLPPGLAAGTFAALDDHVLRDIASELPPGCVADWLRKLGTDAEVVLDRLPPALATDARVMMRYREGTAGALMDPSVTAVVDGTSAGDVRTILQREAGRLSEYVYAVTREHHLVGVVNVSALARADAGAPVSTVTRPGIDWVPADTALPVVEAHPGWRQYDVLPVVDADRRLVGTLRHRTLRQHTTHTNTRRPGDDAMRTLVALGEVYWLGLSGLLHGLSVAAGTQGGSVRSPEEGKA